MSKRKIEVVIEETVKYARIAVVEADMNDSNFETLLDEAERSDHPDDVLHVMREQGVNIIKPFDNHYGSPFDCEIEITEFGEVND